MARIRAADIAVVRLGPAGGLEPRPVRGGAAVGIGRGRVGGGRQQPAHEMVRLSVHGHVKGGGFPLERPAVNGRAVVQQIVDDIGGTDVDCRHQSALVVGAGAEVSDRCAGLDQPAHQPEVAGAGGLDARLTGRAGFRLVDPGNIVHATDTTGVVTIVKLQPISVVFTAPEEDVPEINKALAAGTVPVTAMSSDGTKVLSQGHLAFVNNAVDQASGTIRMKATFANTDNVLWPGLSVSTRLLLETLKQVTVVPDMAVDRGPDGLYAFVVGTGNKIAMRSLKVGQQGDGESVITSGLTPGENVVVSGQYKLAAGHIGGCEFGQPRRRSNGGGDPCHAGAVSVEGGISAPFIRHPIATSLLMIGILFVGIVAYPLLPVAPLPQVDFPTIQVSALLPGAGPDTMASSVAQPLETQFAQIPGVSEMTSVSTLGATAITIQFDLSRNIDGAAADVLAAINAAGGQLPKNLPAPPTFRKVNPADLPILLLAATSDTLPLTVVDDNVETKLAQQISQVPGVGQVLVGGQQKPAVRIQLDPAKLVAKGVSLEDVRTQLAVATADGPKGSIEGPRRAFTIFTNDQLTQAKAWDNVIVAYHNDGPLRVRDIGTAIDGAQDTTQAGWADGKRGVFLVIFQQPGANVIQTVGRIMKELPHLEATIPRGIRIFTLSDRTQTIRAAVSDVQFTLLLTIGLVVMVIFLFLRSLWATVIPSITVPLALLGACGLMWGAGYSLDNLSLMALTISVGFVVDDAIVMLENITRYIEEGEAPFAAALKGSKEIAFTIVSISISLIAVLIPLLLMGGIIGRLFREFAVTLSMTIVVSAAVSLTLTPMMASRFLKPMKEVHHGRLYAWSERAFDRLLTGYERGLDLVLRFRFITLLVFLATLALSVILFMVIPKGFFPQQDTGLITGISEFGQDVSVPADDEVSGGTRCRCAKGSSGRSCGHGDRRVWLCAQHGTDVHYAETAR